MSELAVVEIESLDPEGRGVGHNNGKVIFVEGALPGERVRIETLRARAKYDNARVIEVLPASVSGLIVELRGLIGMLSIRSALPQLELAVSNDRIVLVARILQPLTDEDRRAMDVFARAHSIEFWLQPGGPDTARPLADD